jgi:hypothetical protein
MAVLMSLGGNPAGDGFLVAPQGSTYDAELALWTDAGTANVTLQAAPNPAGLVFAHPRPHLPPPDYRTVHSRRRRARTRDTTIQVLDGMAVVVNPHCHRSNIPW